METNIEHKIKLLIIEDDPSQIFLIKEALNSNIYEVTDIPDGNEALEYLVHQKELPDLILMDYHLPGLDGLSILKKLQENNRKYNIIFLTADYSIDTAIQSINAGALDFIPKDHRFVNNIATIVNKAYQAIKAENEKQQFEKALKESEDRFKTVIEASKDGIFEWNLMIGFTHSSPNNAYMLGYDPQEFPFQQEKLMELLHPEDREMLFKKLSDHVLHNTPFYEAEIRLKAKNGQYKWILERGIVTEKSEQNTPIRIIGTHSDISERKADEARLVESNRRLTTLISNLPGIVYRCKVGQSAGREFIGGRVKEITGYDPEELVEKNIRKCNFLVYQEDLKATDQKIEQALKNKSDFELYYRLITKEGETRWVWDHGKIILDAAGNPTFIEGYIADVTEKRLSEEALRKSEEEKNIILDNSMHAFVLLTPKGDIITFNKVANHRSILIKGKKLQKNAPLVNFLPDIEQERFRRIFPRVINGEPAYWEQPFDLRGHISWFENVLVPVLITRNDIRYVCYTSTDITERKMAEEKILASENLYNTTINSLNDLLIVVDHQMQVILANEAVIRFNRFNKLDNNIYGKKVSDIFPFVRDSILEIYKRVFEESKEIIVEDVFLVGNKSIHTEMKITPIFQNERVVRAVTIIRDITDRKNFEKRIMNAIIETEERERKRFSEDLHDEMGSLLSTIKIYINTLHSENVPEERKNELVGFTNQLINQAIQNSKEIANNLSPNIIKRFGLISALNSFFEKIQVSSGFKLHFDPEAYQHELNNEEEISIYRVITELVNNSLKHSQGSEISIIFESQINKLVIKYNDNGTGFNFNEALQKNSSGLGLQNILSRISSLNGIYQYNDQNEKGFQIVFELMIPIKKQ